MPPVSYRATRRSERAASVWDTCSSLAHATRSRGPAVRSIALPSRSMHGVAVSRARSSRGGCSAVCTAEAADRLDMLSGCSPSSHSGRRVSRCLLCSLGWVRSICSVRSVGAKHSTRPTRRHPLDAIRGSHQVDLTKWIRRARRHRASRAIGRRRRGLARRCEHRDTRGRRPFDDGRSGPACDASRSYRTVMPAELVGAVGRLEVGRIDHVRVMKSQPTNFDPSAPLDASRADRSPTHARIHTRRC